MVATAMHYIIGVTLAYFLGVKDNKKYLMGLWAVVPDIDALLFLMFTFARRLFDFSLGMLETNQILTVLFAHRGFSHSILLMLTVLGVLYLFKINKKMLLILGVLWASHLFLDFITAWKLFLFLPFSYASLYLGLVEVFDSFLVLFTTLIFGFFIGMSLMQKDKKWPLIFAYGFILVFGTFSSVMMNEFNFQTIFLSQSLFFVIVGSFWLSSRRNHKKVHSAFAARAIRITFFVMIGYLVLLLGGKIGYGLYLDTSITNIEPLEEFAFNFNAHTFEINEGNTYRIGLISLRGIEEDKIVPKINNDAGVDDETVDQFLLAYEKALHINWFNHPVWIFNRDEEGVYANVRYAKTYLDIPHMPGPHRGMNVRLEDGILVRYNGWFG